MPRNPSLQAGFTLIELLVVMGLMAIVAGISFVNFGRPQTAAAIDGTVDALVADIKSQQLKAMAGESGSGTTAQPHGVFIETNRYTLFKGSAYDAGDTDNFIVTAETGVTLSSTLPTGKAIFLKGSGEISGYNGSTDTITATNTAGQTKILELNNFGAITEN